MCQICVSDVLKGETRFKDCDKDVTIVMTSGNEMWKRCDVLTRSVCQSN